MKNKLIRTAMLFAMGVCIYDGKLGILESLFLSALIIGYGLMCYNDGIDA